MVLLPFYSFVTCRCFLFSGDGIVVAHSHSSVWPEHFDDTCFWQFPLPFEGPFDHPTPSCSLFAVSSTCTINIPKRKKTVRQAALFFFVVAPHLFCQVGLCEANHCCCSTFCICPPRSQDRSPSPHLCQVPFLVAKITQASQCHIENEIYFGSCVEFFFPVFFPWKFDSKKTEERWLRNFSNLWTMSFCSVKSSDQSKFKIQIGNQLGKRIQNSKFTARTLFKMEKCAKINLCF